MHYSITVINDKLNGCSYFKYYRIKDQMIHGGTKQFLIHTHTCDMRSYKTNLQAMNSDYCLPENGCVCSLFNVKLQLLPTAVSKGVCSGKQLNVYMCVEY